MSNEYRDLQTMGVSWFVSYCYYENIDKTHRNWDSPTIGTIDNRISVYGKSRKFHSKFLREIMSKEPGRLDTNTIGLSGMQVLAMAQELLGY